MARERKNKNRLMIPKSISVDPKMIPKIIRKFGGLTSFFNLAVEYMRELEEFRNKKLKKESELNREWR